MIFTMSLIGLSACTEELSIADFADDFKDYERELRIEGVLDLADFSKSIIRIDRTVLVTDTSLFNGIDDNGDWVSYSDLNGNGIWDEGEPLNDDIGYDYGGPNDLPEGRGNGIPDPGEPHVDDYIEILPHIHDSTMVSVILRELISGDFVAEFEWTSRASSFDLMFGPEGPPEVTTKNPYYTYYYGAYVPAPEYSDPVLNPDLEYQLEITTVDGQIITSSTTLIGPPTNIQWEDADWVGDTLETLSNNEEYMTWNTPITSNFCAITMDQVFESDSLGGFYASLAASMELDDELEIPLPLFQGNFIGIPLGLYKISIESYTANYGRYVYSGLSIRDRELSTWRDQDENVVLGTLAAKSGIEFYIRLVAPEG